jgi:hypothetical protein
LFDQLGFLFIFFQNAFDDIASLHNANKPAITGDWHMTDAMFGHHYLI